MVGEYTETNGGVGDAVHGTTGQPNVDHLDYRSFEGTGSYADPSYPDNQGLIFIVLHELAHLDTSGYTNLQQEMVEYHRDYSTYNGSYNTNQSDPHSDYNVDKERFANDLLNQRPQR